MATGEQRYGEDSIEVLVGLEPVRKRPGMYVGDVHDGSGLHHMLWELVANAIDEHLAGYASKLRVSFETDLAEVEDDGRGISVDLHPRHGKSVLELYLTTLGYGPTRDGHMPHVHVSPFGFGVGLGAVNALCEDVEVEVRRGGYTWTQRYAAGRPLGPLERGRRTDRTGVRIRVRPDRSIFAPCRFDGALIRARLEELAFFNSALRIECMGRVIHEPSGLVALLERMALEHGLATISDVFSTRGVEDDVTVEVALTWTDGAQCDLRSFAYQAPTPDGGTHEEGFWDGLVRAALGVGAPERAVSVRRARTRLSRGLLAIVHVGPSTWGFSGNARTRLTCPEARDAVSAHVERTLTRYLADRPALASSLFSRVTA
jgi:DNA gyrase subunit B